MRNSGKDFYDFGHFRLDAEKHRLLRNGEIVPLSPKAMETLLVFVRNPGKPLERQELLQKVWADNFVEDANLTVAVSNLRKALGQDGETEEYIETIPRFGYRFVSEVRKVREEPAPLVIEKHTLEQTVIEEEFIQDAEPVAQAAEVRQRAPHAKRLTSALTRHKTASLLAALSIVVAALFTVRYFGNSEQQAGIATALAATPIKSIAVLPPKVLSTDAESASLSFGVADALSARLGSIRKLVVRPFSAVGHYSGTSQDALEAGRALKVDAVIEGSLQHEQGKLRLTLHLIQVSSGTQLWASSFDRNDADIFGLEDSVSEQVAEALSLNLQMDEKRWLAKRPTQNQEAYALYLQGNYFWNKRGNEVGKSYDYFRKAIELDPNFALPYVGLAKAYATASGREVDAEVLIEKALQLDPGLAEAHATYGFIKMFHHWDWAAAGQAFDRAIELDPNSVTAHHWKGVYLSLLGRLDEAKAEMHRALELDPLSMIIMADIGQLHYFAHEYDEAIDYCRRALALDGEFQIAHEYLRNIYAMKGMYQEAFDEWFKVGHPGSSFDPQERARSIYASYSFQSYAKKSLEDVARSRAGGNSPSPIFIAQNYMFTGDGEQALHWLNRAYEEHAFLLPYIKVDPIYEPLRNDPRFQAIVHNMGL